MRSTTPTIHCDGNDGAECFAWDIDNWECAVSAVNGVRITAEHRAPGWTSTDDTDLCPNHAPATTDPIEVTA